MHEIEKIKIKKNLTILFFFFYKSQHPTLYLATKMHPAHNSTSADPTSHGTDSTGLRRLSPPHLPGSNLETLNEACQSAPMRENERESENEKGTERENVTWTRGIHQSTRMIKSGV